ncbi:MAG: hypothetical protein GX485_07090 [Clostridiales bacterium]|jgi:hypothetical protein|nr:hypothetical protein [Clostridiales bacterium]
MTDIVVTGGELEQKEIDRYVQYLEDKNPGRTLKTLQIEVDGDYVNLTYELTPVPFERIRRITGYLVGTTDRWNNAKLAELNDRVTHGMSCDCCH